MKRALLVFALATGLAVTAAVAHDASKGAMTVTTNLKLEAGQTITLTHRPLLIGTGATWDRLKSGKGAYKVGEITTSSKLIHDDVVVPAGTYPLFYSSDGQGNHYLHFGGSFREPGKVKVPLRTQQISPSSKYLILAVSHGNSFQDVHLILAYGELMGRVSFHVD
jgi:hypothetical protein